MIDQHQAPDRAWLIQAALFSAAAALTKFEGLPRVGVVVLALLAEMLVALEPPLPVALGVLYCNPAPTYERDVYAQLAAAGPATKDLNALLRSGRTWSVGG